MEGPMSAWHNLRTNASVIGRWHDNRHTLITDLAEKGASDQTIMDIAGHVSKQILKHYSHIRMEAKRAALESILDKPNLDKPNTDKAENAAPATQIDSAPLTGVRQVEGESLQKSPQSPGICGQKRGRQAAKLLNHFGSPSWTRFELLPSSWPCDRTHGRILFSSSLTRRAELYPCRAPSLDTSRTRQGNTG
jgi:hypothetical protein